MAKSLYKLTEFYATGCQIEDHIEVILLLGTDLQEIDLSKYHLDELQTKKQENQPNQLGRYGYDKV